MRDFRGPQRYGVEFVWSHLIIEAKNNSVFLFRGELLQLISIIVKKHIVICFLHVYENYSAALARGL